MTQEYFVVWSGSLEKSGGCDSLSTYVGNSSLNNSAAEPGLTLGEITAIQLALGLKGRRELSDPAEIAQSARRQRNAERRERRKAPKQRRAA
jgi:hypothetical protein